MNAEKALLIYKVRHAGTYNTLYGLESDYNSVGMTLQTTTGGNRILCRLVDGCPIAESVMDDYVLIGSMDDSNKPVPSSIIECIVNFITENAGQAGCVNHNTEEWHKKYHLFGKIVVMNEDVQRIAQLIEE